jgi:ABC-type multidrug transport system fused ATPase/permease subunit
MMFKRIYSIKYLLNKREQFILLLLSFLLLIGMFLEVLGIGALVPTLEIISDPDLGMNNEWVQVFISFFEIKNNSDVIIYLLASIIFIYVLKTVFLVYLNYKQNVFLFNLNASLSSKLYGLYLNQSYTFHLYRNSANLQKHLQTDIPYFNSFCTSLIIVVTEFSLLFSILISIIWIEPIGAIFIGLFFLILSLLFFSYTKSKMSNWGEKRRTLEGEISKITMEGLRGFKELKLFGRSNYYLNDFSQKINDLSNINSKYTTFNLLPRYYLELISVIVLIGFILIMVIQERPLGSLIATLGIFVAATFKMIPSINKILGSTQNLKYYASAIDGLIEEFKNASKSVQENLIISQSINLKNKITVKDLFFKYNKGQYWVLKSINLEINKGTTIGFIGPSGSGKSSFIDLFVGLLTPDSGKIMVDNIDIHKNPTSWQKELGYVPQKIFLSDSTIIENIAFGIPQKNISIEKVNKALFSAQLHDFVKSLPSGLYTKVGEAGVQLSGGQRQRIGIARALYENPEILVLDEATSSLDTKTEMELMKSIDLLKGKKTILIIAHRLNSLKGCDDIYEIKDGEISKKTIDFNIK